LGVGWVYESDRADETRGEACRIDTTKAERRVRIIYLSSVQN
jgi:hypothetical protein